MATKKAKRYRCRLCNNLDECDPCEECSDSHEYCQICDDWFGDYDECRHIRWVDGICFMGCGSTGVEQASHKEEFKTLLDYLHGLGGVRVQVADVGPLATVEIVRGQVVYLIAQMLRWDQLITVNEGGSVRISRWCEDRKLSLYVIETIPRLPQECTDRRERDLAIGWAWLESLGADDTKKENAMTCEWISEWHKAMRSPTSPESPR